MTKDVNSVLKMTISSPTPRIALSVIEDRNCWGIVGAQKGHDGAKNHA
jgi:hypothetical protein